MATTNKTLMNNNLLYLTTRATTKLRKNSLQKSTYASFVANPNLA